MFKLSNEVSFINIFYSGAVQIPQNLVSKPAVRCIMSTSVRKYSKMWTEQIETKVYGGKILTMSIFLTPCSTAGASLGSLQDGCKMSSKSHKFPKVSFDFQSLVQTIPLRTGALHPLNISAGANAPAAPVLTRPLYYHNVSKFYFLVASLGLKVQYVFENLRSTNSKI